jgi:hypothetical protein
MGLAKDLCPFKGLEWSLVIILSSFAIYGLAATSALASPATIALSPPAGEVGDTVTVEGSGFAPFSEVRISFDEGNASTTPDIVNVDQQGEFAASFEVPSATIAGIKTVRAIDDSANATSAASNFTVINTAPVADPQLSILIAENSSKAIFLSASDVNGDVLVFSISEDASHGSLSDFETESGALVYTPEVDYHGEDSFSFIANDGTEDSNMAIVSIQVVGVNGSNSPPIPENQSVETDEDTSISIVLTAFDADEDNPAFAVVEQPDHGVLSGSPPNLVFTPSANYAGLDSFIFSVNDGHVNSTAFGTVNIAIVSENDLPVAQSMSLNVEENSRKSMILRGVDADGDSLSFLPISEPTHGTLIGSPPNLSYEPFEDYTGRDSFLFVASDWVGDGEPATVLIRVVSPDEVDEQVDEDTDDAYYYDNEDDYDNTFGGGDAAYYNNPPSANSQSISGTEDIPLIVNFSASDPENDYFGFEIVDYPLHGNLTGFDADNGTAIYTPAPEYSGPDTFAFTANDDYGQSDRAIMSIFIAEVNDPPKAIDQYVTAFGNAIDITLTSSDPDSDYRRYTIISDPVNGTLSGTPPYMQYWITNPGTNETDSFSFSVNDLESDGNVGIVWINVAAPLDSTTDFGGNEATDDDLDGEYPEPNISSSNGSAQQNDTASNHDDITPGSDLTSERIIVDKSNVQILLSWEQDGQDEGVERTLNLQFADRRTRVPLGNDVWYDLVVFDNDHKEIKVLRDLVAVNSVDSQKIAFPANGIYHFEVNVKGVIDESTNSVLQGSDVTGTAFGTVVVPEFPVSTMIMAAAIAAILGLPMAVRKFQHLGSPP